MSYRSNVIYSYDGSFDGFLCCVFESFAKKELPAAIEAGEGEQCSLFSRREILTDPAKAGRVKRSIPLKICSEAKELTEKAFLSNLPEKELQLLGFLRLGYRYGGKVVEMLSQKEVDAVKKAVLFLEREAHLITGFLRFSEYDGVLFAQITPKNSVLPVIAPHFCNRFSGENFMIYDKTHKIALVYREGKREFISAEQVIPPEAGPQEEKYRSCWRKFYDTVGIEGRYNPRCRQTHMPKRYWENMTEFQSSL